MTCTPLFPVDGDFVQGTWFGTNRTMTEQGLMFSFQVAPQTPQSAATLALEIRDAATLAPKGGLSYQAPQAYEKISYLLVSSAGYLLILESNSQGMYRVGSFNYHDVPYQPTYHHVRDLGAASPPVVRTSPGDGSLFLLLASNDPEPSSERSYDVFGFYRGKDGSRLPFPDPLFSAYRGQLAQIRAFILTEISEHSPPTRVFVISGGASASDTPIPVPSGRLHVIRPADCTQLAAAAGGTRDLTQFSAAISGEDSLDFELVNTGDDCLIVSPIAGIAPFSSPPFRGLSLSPETSVIVPIAFRPTAPSQYGTTTTLEVTTIPAMRSVLLDCQGVDRRVRFMAESSAIEVSASPGERLEWGFKLQYTAFQESDQAKATFDWIVELDAEQPGDWAVRIYQDHPDPGAQTVEQQGTIARHKRTIELSNRAPATWFVGIKAPNLDETSSTDDRMASFKVRVESTSASPKIWTRAQRTFTVRTIRGRDPVRLATRAEDQTAHPLEKQGAHR